MSTSRPQNVQNYQLYQQILEEEKRGGVATPPQTYEQRNWTEKQQRAHEAIGKTKSSNLHNYFDDVKMNRLVEYEKRPFASKKNVKEETKEVSYQDTRTPEERNINFMEIDPGDTYDTVLFSSLPEIEQTRDNSRKSARETTRDLLALVQGQGENDSAKDLTEEELRAAQEIEQMEFHDFYTGEDGTFGDDVIRPEDKIVLNYADKRQKEGEAWFEENRKNVEEIVQNVDRIYGAYTNGGYRKDTVTFDEAINYAQGYYEEGELSKFTEEQLEQLEIYAMLLQTHDSALQYITSYGENDIYTYEYVRELNQMMDDIVKYNPNAGDKVVYYASEFTSGMAEFFEIGGRYAYALGAEIVSCFQGSNTEKKEAIRQAGKDAISGPLWVDGWRNWAKKTFSATNTDIMIGGILQGLGNATSSSLIGGGWGIGLNALNTAGKGARVELANGADYDSAMLIGGLQGLLDAGMSKAMGGFGITDVNGTPQNLAGLMAEKLCSGDLGKFIGKSMINAALDEGVEALGMYVTPYLRRMTYDPNAEPLSDEQFAEAVLMGYLTKTVTNLALSYPGFIKGLKNASIEDDIELPQEAKEKADTALERLKERAEQVEALEAGGETEASMSRLTGEADEAAMMRTDVELPEGGLQENELMGQFEKKIGMEGGETTVPVETSGINGVGRNELQLEGDESGGLSGVFKDVEGNKTGISVDDGDIIKNNALDNATAEELAFSAIHGSDKADSVMLGKFESGSANSYERVAQDYGSQYFQMEDSEWNALFEQYSREGMWKINEKFLDIQIASGRDIYLSHDPDFFKGTGSFFESEVLYLESHGFRFVQEGDIWRAII